MLARSSLLALSLSAVSSAQHELAPILPPNYEPDAFGAALDVDGPWLVVGENALASGVARVYDSATGDRLYDLPWVGPHMGRAVSVDGDLALVGQPLHGAGNVHLFDLKTGQRLWTKSPNGQWTGGAVALAGPYALVGAPGTNGWTGRAWVIDVATGAVLHELEASDKQTDARFGWSVAIEGQLGLIGAPDAGYPATGAAYVFDLVTGAELARLSGSQTPDQFGERVATDNGLLVVASAEPSAAIRGALYVYDAATLAELAQIRVGSPGYPFGTSLDARDGRALVGTREDDLGGDVAYLIDLQTGALRQRLVPCEGQADSGFGAALALGDGGRSFVGSSLEDTLVPGAGAVRRFTLDPPIGTVYCSPAVPHSGGVAAEIHAWGSPSVAAGDLMLRTDHVKRSQFGYLLASQTQGFVVQPGGSDGNLCLGGTIGRFAKQVQNAGGWRTICVRVELSAMPPPLSPVQPGETWNFQLWYRDGGFSSNFSDAVSVAFQ